MTTDDDPMLNELRGIRSDLGIVGTAVTDERKGRKTTNRLGAVVIAALLLFTYRSDADRRADDRREDRQASAAAALDCESRKERAKLVRDAITAAADEVAIYAGVSEDERSLLERRVSARVLKTVPPPDC